MEDLRHPVEYKARTTQSVPRSSVPAKRVPCRSPSPDIREALRKEETVEEEEPILLQVPQLNGPLAFTPAALKNWGQAHEDHSAQATQFREQLKEWKHTKEDLRKIMNQAYEETRELKEHVISNEVTQEHLFALHMQVKCTATCVREASQNVDQLISIAMKQMTLNVDAIRDFGTVLRAILFNTLGIQDFYQSICSFYVGLMEHPARKYRKNEPFVLNVAHSFEHFLQTCNYVEPLPRGYAQFTGGLATIIHNVYDIDIDELKKASREMRSELNEGAREGVLEVHKGKAETSRQVEEAQLEEMQIGSDELGVILSKDELKAVMKEAHLMRMQKKEEKENAYFKARASSILGRIAGETPVMLEMTLAFAQAMKQDEWEYRLGKMRLNGSEGSSRKNTRKD